MNRDLFPSPAPCCGENISSKLCGVREPYHWIVSIPPSLLFPLYTSPSEAEDQFIFQCALPGTLSKLLLALCVLSSDLGSCFHLGCVWSVNGLEVAGGFETPTGKCWGGVCSGPAGSWSTCCWGRDVKPLLWTLGRILGMSLVSCSRLSSVHPSRKLWAGVLKPRKLF